LVLCGANELTLWGVPTGWRVFDTTLLGLVGPTRCAAITALCGFYWANAVPAASRIRADNAVALIIDFSRNP
jgi:hypothetical protein